MLELRKLFALLVGSQRKYVDPSHAVGILRGTLGGESAQVQTYCNNQQDVSEFTHKLLDWLEEAFKQPDDMEYFGKEKKVPHHPPIDYRYGWNMSRRVHQLTLLWRQLIQPVDLLLASPNCVPWGNDSRATPVELRLKKREEGTATLTFLARACFFQILLGRTIYYGEFTVF